MSLSLFLQTLVIKMGGGVTRTLVTLFYYFKKTTSLLQADNLISTLNDNYFQDRHCLFEISQEALKHDQVSKLLNAITGIS